MRGARPLLALTGALAALLVSSSAAAQLDARRLPTPVLQAPGSARIPLLLRRGPGAAPSDVTPLTPSYAVAFVAPAELSALAARGLSPLWAPPRRTWLDRVGGWTRSAAARASTGLTGRGVVVGIVDTGIDPRHPDFIDPAGRSRIAWLLDLSQRPRGVHAALEQRYGCDGQSGYECAIYSGADLDALRQGSVAEQAPHDEFGHGTHVAGIAAGNGRGDPAARWVGMAPEASLVIVRVARGADGAVFDPDVVLGTRFVFERAEALGQPAVVNLSLGSDFGPHDGSSPLEAALAEQVGRTQPGRAIVVAAGNSGTLYVGGSDQYPAPWGIHTEVHVPWASPTRVPLLVPAAGATTRGALYLWIGRREGDQLAVGVEDSEGVVLPPVPPGASASVRDGERLVTVINGALAVQGRVVPGGRDAVVIISGAWPAGRTHALRFEGQGTAAVWLQAEGELASRSAALLPRASKLGTVSIPGTHPALITVGATLNRAQWVDLDGAAVALERFGALEPPVEDSPAYFSAVGPTSTGALKPTLVAPGAFVGAARSQLTDPRSSDGGTMFGGGLDCTPVTTCKLLDEGYALASGTSMAAPVVTGAVALMLERHPGLTQPELLALLQAGSRPVAGVVGLAPQLGAGALDVVQTLQLLEAPTAASTPTAAHSRLAVAGTVLPPDPRVALELLAVVRGAGGEPVDGFEASRLRLHVDGAQLRRPLTRLAPGLWGAAIGAAAGTGGERARVELRFDGALLGAQRLDVAVDEQALPSNVQAVGGCQLRACTGGPVGPWGLVLLGGVAWWRRRQGGGRWAR